MGNIISVLFLKILPKKLIVKYIDEDERSKLIVKNVVFSIAMKAANIICSLLLVPMTIKYVNSDRYGIWMTLSVIIGWITFFDFGLGNGFRNRFAEAKANGNLTLARQYVSTSYFSIGCITMVLLLCVLLVNTQINWSSFLNLSENYMIELRKVFAIVAIFTCLNMVINIFSTLLSADMNPGLAAVIAGIGQYLVLFTMYFLTLTTKGNLVNLALAYSGIPVLVTFFSSLIFYKFTRYRQYSPAFKYIKIALIRNIINLGFQFMLIQLCMIVVFQIINLVISRELGPEAVTQYSIANKYFNIIFMIMIIILTPIWSSFTDAYTKGDLFWMKKALKKLEQLCIISSLILILMLLISTFAYHFWVGDTVTIPFMLSLTMMVMVIVQNIASSYMYCINGIGCIRVQLIIYLLCAFVSWPILTYFARWFGIVGVAVAPTIVYLAQAVFGRIQLKMILNNSATGIWNK